MTVLGGLLLYAGLACTLAGAVCLLRRRKGFGILGFACLAILAGVFLPAADTRITTPQTRLDEFAPISQFHEFHTIEVRAPAERVYAAVRAVTPEEVRFFRALTLLRFGKPIAAQHRPILDSFTAGSYLPLADDPAR